ncbi:MAG: type II secretion system protein M [Gammaproteobacteria bacterium]|nr:type II secretion system protein M [Gammaproteobacteria bacterium]
MDLQQYLSPIQDWLDSLEKRERHVVLGGATILIISLFYFLIWQPVFDSLELEQEKYNSQRELYFWMKDAAAEVKTFQQSGTRLSNRYKNQSISSLAEMSAQSRGVKQNISKLDSNNKGVKAELNQVSFDNLVLWLADLAAKYNIHVSSLHIEKLNEAGTVNARVSLERDPS